MGWGVVDFFDADLAGKQFVVVIAYGDAIVNVSRGEVQNVVGIGSNRKNEC